ncbi:hypothetical protein CsSME_00038306 [Camellia sinensis var. sinensis]
MSAGPHGPTQQLPLRHLQHRSNAMAQQHLPLFLQTSHSRTPRAYWPLLCRCCLVTLFSSTMPNAQPYSFLRVLSFSLSLSYHRHIALYQSIIISLPPLS